jgi:hypothetical protein
LALLLAAGCGSSGHRAPARDGAADGANDGLAQDGAPRDTQDARGDATGDATDARDGGPTDLSGDGSAKDTAGDATDAQRDLPRADVPVATSCPDLIPPLTVGANVKTTLSGSSRNPVVSCRGGTSTPGPEAFFSLTLTEATTVDIAAGSDVSPLIAIRPGACRETISELACVDGPPSFDFQQDTYFGDAGADSPSHWTLLRTPLDAGTYTIVVDTYDFGELQSANLMLSVRRVEPRANASCGMPVLLSSGTILPSESLDLGSPRRSVCGTSAQSSLFYTVGVPPGQRLTARATPTGGQFTWMPRIEAFTSCSASSCLAQGRLSSGLAQQLDWINNGTAWQLVYLAVGSDTQIQGASFDLGVTVADTVATCNRPVPVKDGTTLVGQDFSFSLTTAQTCVGASKALYYTATLLPKQTLNVRAQPSVGSTLLSNPFVSVRTTCDASQCNLFGDSSSFTNSSDQDQAVIIEVTPTQSTPMGTFDLSVEMPAPPAGIVVFPTADLVTSESGRTATFSIVLTSPPTADVTIAVASDTPTEGTASPASVRFTSTNWRTPQTITVTGVDDQVSDGPREYTIVTSPAVSKDGRYSGLDADDVDVTNLDDDPGVAFSGPPTLITTEGGGTATFTAALNAAPTANVTLTLSSSDISEATVSPTQLTFTPTNWNQPQTVTVTGVDDAITDGSQPYQIVTAKLVSSDPRYANFDPPDLAGVNLDDDQIAVSTKVLSGEHNCAAVQTVVDQGGRIYVAMSCDNQILMTTSTDGGVTFTAPTAIPNAVPTDGLNLAAGAPGLAYLVFIADGNVLQLIRTSDGGATWSTPINLSNVPDGAHVSAGQRTVFIVTHAPNDGNALVLWRSVNGGRSFSTKRLSDTSNVDATIGPDGQTAWLLQLDGSGTLSKSTDAGATFTSFGSVQVDTSIHVFGRTHLYTIPNDVEIFDLTDPSLPETGTLVGFDGSSPFMTAIDDADGFSLLDLDGQNRLRASRITPSASPTVVRHIVGPSPSAAGLAAISPKATAIATLNGSLVLYTTVIW